MTKAGLLKLSTLQEITERNTAQNSSRQSKNYSQSAKILEKVDGVGSIA